MKTTNRKTGKAQLSTAIDNFFYRLDWVTGGTREETLRQADGAIADLEKMAEEIKALAANPSKPLAAYEWLMNRALVTVPERLESYRLRNVGQYENWKLEQRAKREQEEKELEVLLALDALTATPENVIFHNFAA